MTLRLQVTPQASQLSRRKSGPRWVPYCSQGAVHFCFAFTRKRTAFMMLMMMMMMMMN